MKNNTDVESLDTKEIEVVQTGNSLIDTNQGSMQDMEWLANNIGDIADRYKKTLMGILRLTMPGDFVEFGSKGKKTIELTTAACERIAIAGVSLFNSTIEKEVKKDAKGEFYNYIATAKATFRDRSVDVESIVSSRDPFYGVKGGKFKEISDISENDIRRAARRGLMKEGVKVLLGLRRLDPDELNSMGISLTKVGGYNFQDKDEVAENTSVIVERIENVTQKATKKSILFFVYAGGEAYRTFSESFAEIAKECMGISLTKNASQSFAEISYQKTQYGNQIVSIRKVEEVKK